MGHRYAHGTEQHFLEAAVVVQQHMHRSARKEFGSREVALGGGYAQAVHHQREQTLVAQRRSQQGLVVPQQDPPPGLRLLPRHLAEPGDQRLGQRMLDRRVMVVTLQVLAAGGGRQAVRLDHPADEPGPGRQQVAGVIVEQHAAKEYREIAVVAGAIGAAVLDPQQALHVDPLVRAHRQAADRFEVMFETRGELQVAALPLQRVQRGVGGQPPRRRLRVDRLGVAADVDRLAQQHAVAFEDLAQARGLGQRTVFVLQFEGDLGAYRARRHRRHAVLLGVAGDVAEAQLRLLVGRGPHADPAGQDESGEEAQAEHADQPAVLVAGLAQSAGVADADGGQVGVDFVLGEPGAGVDDAHGVAGTVADHLDSRRPLPVGLLQAATEDRVVGVLHQFAQRHGGRGIEVLAEHRHHAVEVDSGATDLGSVRLRKAALHVPIQAFDEWRPLARERSGAGFCHVPSRSLCNDVPAMSFRPHGSGPECNRAASRRNVQPSRPINCRRLRSNQSSR
ncbi:Uncharacterised protein [Klebsiella pneumoniae]|nr:Uncharacterised protein [Klebsiella pneumoniae]